MIPKIIHYCWFGNKKIPLKFKKYIKSWKRHCPDYEIKLWNETNYDINKNNFLSDAAKAGKWAFVSDYARLDIIEQFGGIYLDTDVELIKNLDNLLNYQGFAGFECSDYVNFGLGFGAEAHNPLVKEMKDFYTNSHFSEDFIKNYTCPIVQTKILMKHGLINNRYEQEIEGFHIFPTDYFCPMNYNQILDNLTKNSYSIHHFAATWFSKKEHQKFMWNNFKAKTKLKIKKIINWKNINGK